jgi:integrase
MGKVVRLTEALGLEAHKREKSGKDEWISVPGFGQLWRRGNTWWIKYSVDGRVYRESSKSTDQRAAEKLLRARIKASGRGGRFVDPNKERRVTIDNLLDALALYHQQKGNRHSLACRLEPLRRHLGHERTVTVDGERIAKYKADRLREKTRRGTTTARATINRELAALRKALKLGVEWNRISGAPKIELFPEQNVREGFVEPGTFEKIAAQLKQPWRDAATFAYVTGWRFREVFDLAWSEVDLEARTVALPARRAKSKKGRALVLAGDLLALVERRYELRDGRLLFHHQGRRIMDIRKRWHKATAAAGVPGLLFHDLRRSGVRNLVRAGVDPTIAMRISGHKTRAIFDRYNIIDESDIAQALVAVQEAAKHAQ